jgi:hypothetical protein
LINPCNFIRNAAPRPLALNRFPTGPKSSTPARHRHVKRASTRSLCGSVADPQNPSPTSQGFVPSNERRFAATMVSEARNSQRRRLACAVDGAKSRIDQMPLESALFLGPRLIDGVAALRDADADGNAQCSAESTYLSIRVPRYPDEALARSRVFSIDAAPGAEFVHEADRERRRRGGPTHGRAIRASPPARPLYPREPLLAFSEHGRPRS